jgi:hypothetical protein
MHEYQRANGSRIKCARSRPTLQHPRSAGILLKNGHNLV